MDYDAPDAPAALPQRDVASLHSVIARALHDHPIVVVSTLFGGPGAPLATPEHGEVIIRADGGPAHRTTRFHVTIDVIPDDHG